MDQGTILTQIQNLGATRCLVISPRLLTPDEKIRNYCVENKCGCYGKHLMCPPNTGTISEAHRRFSCFETAILIQYFRQMDVRKDPETLRETKQFLHHIVLGTEKYFREILKHTEVWGLIGGSCSLCNECAGYQGATCPYPEKARTSLEAMGIDVISLLGKLGLDNGFHDDRITWTAMVLTDGAL